MTESAHTLKSTSANLGAVALAALCKELETMGRQARSDGADEILVEIDRLHPLVCTQLAEVKEAASDHAGDVVKVASANA